MRWLATQGSEPEAEVGQDGDLCISMAKGFTFQKRGGVWVCYGKGWPE